MKWRLGALSLLLWGAAAHSAPFLIVPGVFIGPGKGLLLPHAAEAVDNEPRYVRLPDETARMADQAVGAFLRKIGLGSLTASEASQIFVGVARKDSTGVSSLEATDLPRRLKHCSASSAESIDLEEPANVVLVRLKCQEHADFGSDVYGVFTLENGSIKSAAFTIGETLPVHVDLADRPDLVAKYVRKNDQ